MYKVLTNKVFGANFAKIITNSSRWNKSET